MYHSAKFMFDLEDHDNALQFLLVGERFLDPLKTRRSTLVLTLNHIQSIYQQRNDYSKGIEYAKKIIRATDSIRWHDPDAQEFYRFWQGLATIDIASMLLQQQKFAEGEKFADQGYVLTTSVQAGTQETLLEGEFDAIMPLFFIKLKLNKIVEAEHLLQRADRVWTKIGHKEFNYFKQIRLWEAHARLAEIKGDFAASVRYERRAKPLQDSLNRRTDARKLEKIKQRVEARKYTEKIKLIEREKQTQTRLLHAALLGLLLVAVFAYWNYRRLQNNRRQATAALETAQKNLETYIQHFLEKSEQAENLRVEITRFSSEGDRNQYLQELLRSTILTEQDWVQFQALFEKVYPDFIQEQKKRYPEITQAELRYLVLEKLELNTQAMAKMLGVSDGTIRQTRFRLRKKSIVTLL
jgi:predicted transcriptional regulator